MTLTRRGTLRLAIVAGVALMESKGAASAELEDLKLYGVVLRAATVTEFLHAASRAGVRTISRPTDAGATLQLDASGAGVPGLQRFELLRDGENIISVQFRLGSEPDVDESLRKLLEAKYGPPERASGDRYMPGQFADRYGGARARWPFASGMALVYHRPFMGDAHLTYLNQARFDRAMTRAAARAASSAQTNAKQLGEKF